MKNLTNINELITKVEMYFLKKIMKKVVLQGNQKEKIKYFHSLFIKAIAEEYTEDNRPTMEHFMVEMHNDAMKDTLDKHFKREVNVR